MKFYFPILIFCLIGFCSSKQKLTLSQTQLDSLIIKEAMHYDSLVQKSSSIKKLNDNKMKMLKLEYVDDSAFYLMGYEYHIQFIGDSTKNLKKIEIQFHHLLSYVPQDDFQDLNDFFNSNGEGFDIKSNVYTIGFVTNDKQRIYLYHFENGKKLVWVIYHHRYYKRINLN
jgi:hypothetical protein